jgi:N1-aminopropylagmatine ureohydrolase
MAGYSNFLGLQENLDNVTPAFAILPLPIETTVSYGRGCSQGPAALLEASCQVELFDQETKKEPDLDGVFLTLPPPDIVGNPLEQNLNQIEQTALEQIQSGKTVIGIGGEHSVSLPLIKAATEKHPDLTVIFFDAHADLRNSYEGSPLSHACVSRRVSDLGLPIVSAAVRSYCAEEYEFMQSNERVVIYHARECLADNGLQNWQKIIEDIAGPIYLSFDVDALDPSVMPGTGTPEPGGLDYNLACTMIGLLLKSHRMVGLDICELSPIPGSQVSEFTAAKLLYQTILYHLRFNAIT